MTSKAVVLGSRERGSVMERESSGSPNRVPRRSGILGGCPYAPGGASRCDGPACRVRERRSSRGTRRRRGHGLQRRRRRVDRFGGLARGRRGRGRGFVPRLQRRPPIHRQSERERGDDVPGRPGMRRWRLHRSLRRSRCEPRQPRMRFLGGDAGDDRRRVRQAQPCFAMFVANTWPLGAALTVAYAGKSYDPTTFGYIPSQTAATQWPALTAQGIPVGNVAVSTCREPPTWDSWRTRRTSCRVLRRRPPATRRPRCGRAAGGGTGTTPHFM